MVLTLPLARRVPDTGVGYLCMLARAPGLPLSWLQDFATISGPYLNSGIDCPRQTLFRTSLLNSPAAASCPWLISILAM